MAHTQELKPLAARVHTLHGRGMLWTIVLLLSSTYHGMSANAQIYMNPRASWTLRAKDLLSKMTLDEKIGQMTLIDSSYLQSADVAKHLLGGVLFGGNSALNGQETPAQWADYTDGLQKSALSTRLKIPLFTGVDAVHGHAKVFGATVFPHNIGLGCSGDLRLIRRIGGITAAEVRATGINWDYAPTVAACQDPRWGRCYESFSENGTLTAYLGSSLIEGLQAWNRRRGANLASPKAVAACAKHFVADGATEGGVNEGNAVVSRANLIAIHMPPYRGAISRDVLSVMVSFSSVNGVKMSTNKELVTGYLKGTLRFSGFVVSDWGAIKPDKLGVTYEEGVALGVNAGIDMVMVPDEPARFIQALKGLVQARKVSLARINDAVFRILKAKMRMALLERPLADRSFQSVVGSQYNRLVAREAVRKSLVLLKNKLRSSPKGLLPLSTKAPKVLVAGMHADNMGLQCGGWTMAWQGKTSPPFQKGTTILQGIKGAVGAATKVDYVPRPAAGLRGYSYGVVVVGEQPYAETTGDNGALTLTSEDQATISNVCGAMSCVVVLISGRPLTIENLLPKVDAFVAAWLPGSEGGGVADVLFGKYKFTGKLAISWFRNVGQLPMNINNKGKKPYNPLFPYGHGLVA